MEEAGQAGVHSLPAHMRDLDGASRRDSLKLTSQAWQEEGVTVAVVMAGTGSASSTPFRDLSVSTEAESKREGSAGVTFDSAEVVHSPSITKSLTSKRQQPFDESQRQKKVPHADAASVLAPPTGSPVNGAKHRRNSGSAAIPGHVQNLADRLANTTDSMQMNVKTFKRSQY